jgi:hypothetical protein
MNGDQEQVLLVRKMRAGTIYKLLFIGLVVTLIPFGVVIGISGFFGSDSVKWNNEPIHGVAALFAGPALGVFIAIIFTGILGSLTSLGLWLFSKAHPISIRFVPSQSISSHAQQVIQADIPASGGPAA